MSHAKDAAMNVESVSTGESMGFAKIYSKLRIYTIIIYNMKEYSRF